MPVELSLPCSSRTKICHTYSHHCTIEPHSCIYLTKAARGFLSTPPHLHIAFIHSIRLPTPAHTTRVSTVRSVHSPPTINNISAPGRPTLVQSFIQIRQTPFCRPNNQRSQLTPFRQPAMLAVFTSVTRRLFRRRSLLAAAAALQPAPPAPASRKGKSKSRHELVSEAHIAYMQQASSFSTASSSSLSLPWANGCSSGRCREEEGEESSPFDSLCHELRRVEESMCRYLRVPAYRAMGSEPPHHLY